MAPDISEFYPPNPKQVPPELTKPTFRYRLQAGIVAASLSLFLLIYFLLILGFGLFGLCAFLLVFDAGVLPNEGPGTVAVVKTVLAFLGLSSGLVALYFFKGLF